MLKKAIIPAAGRGTRVADIAGAGSKECVPVAGLPMIGWTLAELALGGVDDVCVVVSPTKSDLVAWLNDLPAFPSPDRLRRLYSAIDGSPATWPRITLAEQAEPRGVVDALSRGTRFLDGDPFLLTMPDNFFVGDRPPAAVVAERFAETGRAVMGTIEVDREAARHLGNVGRVEVEDDGDGGLVARRLQDKGPGTFRFPDGTDRARRAVGRTVVPAAFADLTASEFPRKVNAAGEIDDVQRLQALVRGGDVSVVTLDARLHDLGQAEGLATARRVLGA